MSTSDEQFLMDHMVKLEDIVAFVINVQKELSGKESASNSHTRIAI